MRVEGVSDLIRTLRALPEAVAKERLQVAVRAAAEPIRDRMEAIAPKGDPGEPNVSDIVINKVRNTDPWTAAVWIGPPRDAYYAYFLEFGTKFMRARPFARPAFDSEQEHAQAVLKQDVWDAFLGALR